MLSIPFALVGGVLLQAALGYAMTTAVVIGYVSLFAIVIQTGILMVVFIREALARRAASQSYRDAVIDGSELRLRPKLMTVVATALSLLPVMLSGEEGTELMKPIATPSLGGMATSVVCVLFLVPCLFVIADDVRQWLARPARAELSEEDARA
jgi:Cu(I)/Ag(I) efflux system membrane protein CusA/SilA